MKTLREEIEWIVECTIQCQYKCEQVADERACVESAILQAIRLVLEREPSEEMRRRGNEAIGLLSPPRPSHIYRAMTAELLKELEK